MIFVRKGAKLGEGSAHFKTSLGFPCGVAVLDVEPSSGQAGGAAQLRSNGYAMGFKDFRGVNKKKCEEGSNSMRFCCDCFGIAKKSIIPASGENPETSRLWMARGVRKTVSSPMLAEP